MLSLCAHTQTYRTGTDPPARFVRSEAEAPRSLNLAGAGPYDAIDIYLALKLGHDSGGIPASPSRHTGLYRPLVMTLTSTFTACRFAGILTASG